MDIIKAKEEFRTIFYTNIGCTIILCGLVENQLKTIVNEMSISPTEKVEFINSLNGNENIRMMGNLINQLKDKFNLSNDFLVQVRDFTNRRNKLVHDLPIEYSNKTSDLVKLIELHIFVSELRKTSKMLIDTLSNIVITVASNIQNPIDKTEIEILFQTGEDANNIYIEQLKEILTNTHSRELLRQL